MNYLVERGANLGPLLVKGIDMLFDAVEHDHFALFKALIKKGI